MTDPKRSSAVIEKAVHGAIDYGELARLGMDADDVVDFSVNSNAFGPAPGLLDAIYAVPLSRYPDRDCLELRREIANYHAVEMENTVVGNGTSELIQCLAYAYLATGKTAVVFQPTYSEYARAAKIAGADVEYQPWDSLEAILHRDTSRIDDDLLHNADVVFLCNPNNPTGRYLEVTDIVSALVERHPKTLFVIDEAYSEFLTQPASATRTDLPNLIVLRSMTKDFALAGLRLGYAVGHESIIRSIEGFLPAWNVNSFAQVAGVHSLRSLSWLRDSVGRLHENKRDFVKALNEQGWETLDSSVHYFLIRIGDGATVRSALLRDGILVRDCASFGLPDCIRVCTRLANDNQRLLDSLQGLRDHLAPPIFLPEHSV